MQVFEDYKHPLIVNGQRYLFRENPFVYAKWAVQKYMPEELENRTMDIFGLENAKGNQMSFETARDFAISDLSKYFLTDSLFLQRYKNDGYDFVQQNWEQQTGMEDNEYI